MNDIFYEYFLKPIETRAGYNIVNTMVYGIILVLGCYTFFKGFKKIGVKFDYEFFKSITPLIIFSALARVLTDAGVYPHGFFTVTPGIFIPILSITLLLIIANKLLENHKKSNFHRGLFWSGTLFAGSQLFFFRINDPGAIGLLALYVCISSIPVLILARWVPLCKERLNKWVILSHMIDASATVVALDYYDYFDVHVFSGLWIEGLGT